MQKDRVIQLDVFFDENVRMLLRFQDYDTMTAVTVKG